MKLAWRGVRRLATPVVAGFALLTMASCMAPYPMPLFKTTTTQPPTLPPVALSPDGRTVAFSARRRGVGLYEWQTGQVRYLPPPAEFEHLVWPSYSPEGSRLAVSAHLPLKTGKGPVPETRLGIIDLATQRTISFPTSGFISQPVFRPDGKAVLYLEGKLLILFDLETRTSRPLLSDEDSFSSIEGPSFIDNDTIFFVGSGPRNPELKRKIDALGKNASLPPTERTSLPNLLRIGSRPELAYLDFVKRQLSIRLHQVPAQMPASRNGDRMAFIVPSPNTSAHELYVLENGKVRQVTHLETFIAGPAISLDGSTAAFGIHESTSYPLVLELAVVDLTTGRVTRTDFIKRVYGPAIK